MPDGRTGPAAANGVRNPDEWVAILPVPEGAAPAPAAHPKKGTPAARWTYRDLAGRVLGHVWQFGGIGAEQSTLTWCRHGAGEPQWRFKTWPVPRPLYGLDRLSGRPSDSGDPSSFAEDVTEQAPVVVCGDERAADAAARLLPGWVAVTSPGGARAAGKADWRPLSGRRVVLWRAASDDGLQYAHAVAGELAEIGITPALAEPPADVDPGWDAAEALANGWASDQALAFIERAQPLRATDGSGRSGDGRRSRRDLVLELGASVELWHSPTQEPYVTFETNGHLENCAIRTQKFRDWLTHQFWKTEGLAASRSNIDDNMATLAARAIYEGPTFDPRIRHGVLGDKVYIDLGDPYWRAVEIDARGWRITGRPPVKFVRPTAMLPLPAPIADEVGLGHLRSLVNVSDRPDDAQFKQLCAWIVGAYMPRGPYPLLLINGEEGASKSTTSRMLQALTDPSQHAGLSFPSDQRELFIHTKHVRVPFFDNLSHLSKSASDDLARLSTGASFAVRKLHSNDEQQFFSAMVPICLNGIPDIVNRPDLLSRTIIVTLEKIANPRTERDLWAHFEQLRPMMLAGIFDAVSAGMRRFDQVVIEDGGRMADFERFIAAAELALGWQAGDFSRIYREMREGAFADAFEDSVVCTVVHRLMRNRSGARWAGTATELYSDLNLIATEDEKKLRDWPKAPNKLSSVLSRLVRLLRQAGIEFKRDRLGTAQRSRLIILEGPSDAPAP